MGSTRDLTVCAKESRALLYCMGEIQGPPPGLSLPRLQPRGSTNELLGWAHHQTREWVEGGTFTSFYNFTADEAYRYLEDLAGYDYQCWNPPKMYQCFEEGIYNPVTYQDPLNPTTKCFLELHTESTQYLEATQLHGEEQRRKQIGQLQNQLDHLQRVMSIIPIPQEDTIAAMSRREELKRV